MFLQPRRSLPSGCKPSECLDLHIIYCTKCWILLLQEETFIQYSYIVVLSFSIWQINMLVPDPKLASNPRLESQRNYVFWTCACAFNDEASLFVYQDLLVMF